MASSSFCYIAPKNGLARDKHVNDLVAKIIEKVAEIPQHNTYRNNMELLKMVCCMIEHGINNKDKKIKVDKKDIVFRVYTRLWEGMKPQDLKDLEANIMYLWESGQVKKRSLLTVVSSSVCDWFRRKVL